ncbi:MAG: SulP family inorganic anion transporter [Acidiferrobacteraceae bacterium]
MPKKLTAASCPVWLSRALPPVRWWHRVTRPNLRSDLIAGLTGAIVVLPQGVAFATIAGMPPQYGLYAGMIPAIIAAFFGSSWHLVSGPTTAASVVLFSSLSALAEPTSAEYVRLALTLTFMVGIVQLVLGFARMGVLVNFISHSVVIGFTAGAAILIANNQVKHFLGMDLPRGAHVHETIYNVIQKAEQIDPYVVVVGLVTLFAGLIIKRFWPRLPYMIIAMLIGSVLAVVMMATSTEAAHAIKTVGALPATLPPLSAPDFSLQTIRELAPAAVAVTLFALTEAISIARSLAARSGQHLDGNQEFIGQGLSNMVGSFFSGYVATGSFNRSGVNFSSGAKTPLAAAFAGAMLIGIVLLIAPLAAYLPNAAMAGILFLVAWGLIDFHHIRKIFRTSRTETVIMAATFAATLFLELEFAIFLGVLLSLVVYLSRTSRPRILTRVPNPATQTRKFTTDPALPECPQVKIIRIDGSMFFGAVNHIQETLRGFEERSPGQKHLAIVATGINFIDVEGAEYLAQEAEKRRKAGGGLYLIRVKEAVCEPFKRGHYLDQIGEENIFSSKTDAISTIFSKVDPEICRNCKARVFLECKHAPGAEANESGKALSGQMSAAT